MHQEFSEGTVESWQGTHRTSSWRQYESVWAAFVHFLRTRKVASMSREVVASFMRHLFDDKKLAPKTIQSYKVGLTRPLRAWGINTSDEIFSDLIRAFGNLRPAEPYRPITWSLDKVLIMLSEVEYSSAGNLEWILSKALFLLSLATGGKISEIHALRREPEFLAFGEMI